MALWGGRFSSQPEEAMFALSRSVHFDWRLAPYDLRSSLAHVSILQEKEIIDSDTGKKLEGALRQLQKEVAAGTFTAIDSEVKCLPEKKQNIELIIL